MPVGRVQFCVQPGLPQLDMLLYTHSALLRRMDSCGAPALSYCPAQAKEIGSDYIVVGRPITAAADPVAAYERCIAEFVG